MNDLKSLIAAPATAFPKLSPTLRKKQLEALRYIELISTQANIPVSSWDIMNVFRDTKNKGRVITDRSSINRRLFEAHEATAKGNKKSLAAGILSRKDDIIQLLNSPIEDLRVEVLETRTALSRCRSSRSIAAKQNRINNLSAQITTLSADIENWYKQIAKVVIGGHWQFKTVKNGNIEFITTNDVVIFEKNSKARVDIQINMGIYLVKLNMHSWRLTVCPFKNNLMANNRVIHPYVPWSGDATDGNNVCFGNAYDSFETARSKKDLAQMMTILINTLNTYSSVEGPHESIQQFKDSEFMGLTAEAKRYYGVFDAPSDEAVEALLADLEGTNVKTTTNQLAGSITKYNERNGLDHNGEPEEYDDDDYEEDEEDEGYF